MSTTFGQRLAAAMHQRGPLCVGVDPHPGLLAQWGLPDDASGLARFCELALQGLGSQVAALKPQLAFFERHGSAGIAVLERFIGDARSLGALTVVDAKRGDIGSTMSAYADAFCTEGGPLAGDAVTLSPYLGFESLRPALDAAAASGRGVFVLALTSNPEGAAVQHAGAGGPSGSVAAQVVAAVTAENAAASTGGELGSVGLVVGATVGQAARDLGIDLAATAGPLLVPGLGAQGGTPQDIAAVAGGAGHLVLPTTSRGVLRAGPDPAALSKAARLVSAQCRAALADEPPTGDEAAPPRSPGDTA